MDKYPVSHRDYPIFFLSYILSISLLPYKITTVYKYSLEKEDMKIWDWLREDWYTMRECVWLPRIDQYCNMGGMGWAALAEKCIELFPRKEHGLYLYPTFERAAITVVMKSMFRKSWNGEDWI